MAIAMVQTESLRPSFLPAAMGRDFFLSGYRIFCRYQTRQGRTLRGLRILRSDTDNRLMMMFGNLLTHYNYRKADVNVRQDDSELEIRIHTPNAEADLHVLANLRDEPQSPPPGSPFRTLKVARRYAGPLPFTFDYEAGSGSIVMIQGVRQNWNPKPVNVRVTENSFLRNPIFQNAPPVLANAFHLQDVPYQWRRGVVEKLALP